MNAQEFAIKVACVIGGWMLARQILMLARPYVPQLAGVGF
jgi:hypothetical protein